MAFTKSQEKQLQENSAAKAENQETELAHVILEHLSNGQRSTAVCLQEGNLKKDENEIISITAERTGQATEFML